MDDDITSEQGQDAGEHAGRPSDEEPRSDRDAGGPTADPESEPAEGAAGGAHGRPSPFEPHQ